LLQNMIIAGIGGQGVQSMGTLLANAALKEGKEVVWRPSYKGVMRGGISDCILNIGDEFISSPIVTEYDVLVAFNQPGLKTYENQVKSGGLLVWESTKIKEPPSRSDIKAYGLPAYEKATSLLKNVKVMNMIMLGALIKINPIVKKASLFDLLAEILPARNHSLIPLNKEAIELGMSLVNDMSF
jgi:2-oxoglutarate ferredoxin oxidoreductase subunit gamma